MKALFAKGIVHRDLKPQVSDIEHSFISKFSLSTLFFATEHFIATQLRKTVTGTIQNYTQNS